MKKFEDYFGFTKKAEAWTRTKLIDFLEEKLRGGLHEFLRSKLLSKNDLLGYSKHWMNEAKRLVEQEFAEAFYHEVKGVSNYDAVFKEAKESVQRNQIKFMTYVESVARKTFEPKYKIKFKLSLDDSDLGEFWTMVDETYSLVKSKNFKGEKTEKVPSKRNKDFKK